jgi:hypothetical protein
LSENPSSGYLKYAQALTLFLEYEGDTGSSLSSANDFGQPAGAEGVHASDEASIRRIISEICDENLPLLSSGLSYGFQIRMGREQRSHAQNGTKKAVEGE